MKTLYIYIFLFLVFVSRSQNMVPNNSFEIMTTSTVGVVCPTGGNPNYYYQCLENWYNPSSGFPAGSPDLFSYNCSSQCGIPKNNIGTQHTKDGNFYVGFSSYARNILSTPDYKEYLSIKLTDTLQIGKIYCFSMYVSLADSSRFIANPLSVYFSANDISVTNNAGPLPYSPQLDFVIPNDTANWIKLQSSFVASGNETYMTIGSFRDSANMQVSVVNPLSSFKLCYFYIDDISLVENIGSCITGIEEQSYGSEVVRVYPNPASGLVTISSKYEMQKVELTTITGQLLLSEPVNQTSHQLQLQNFAEGIYFVKVWYTNGMSVTKKVVVNH